MDRPAMDEARENRITMEIVVDAYGPEERAMSWYCYLDDRITCASGSIDARCIRERAISPLQVGDSVDILHMAAAAECEHEMFVMIRWGTPGGKQGLGVPLSQLEIVRADEDVCQVVGDWHYWVDRGYEF